MDGPTEDFRHSVYSITAEYRDAADSQAEQVLEGVLSDIEGNMLQDIAGDSASIRTFENEEDAMDALAAIESWASLISAAVARTYAPASPFPRSVAGWAKSIAKRLHDLVNILLLPLKGIAYTLGASSYSIGFAFPWGVSVSLNY